MGGKSANHPYSHGTASGTSSPIAILRQKKNKAETNVTKQQAKIKADVDAIVVRGGRTPRRPYALMNVFNKKIKQLATS